MVLVYIKKEHTPNVKGSCLFYIKKEHTRIIKGSCGFNKAILIFGRVPKSLQKFS